MKCSVATRINTRKMDKPVKEFGAKIISKLSVTRVNPSDFSEKATLPTKKQINEMSSFDKGASYIFTNPEPTSVTGLRKLVDTADSASMRKLISSGSNLFKGVADGFFSGKPNAVLNPITNEATQLIVEGDINSSIKDSDTKGFIRITADDMTAAKEVVDREFLDIPAKEDGQEYTAEKNELLNEGLEFLLISALYRGYNVAIDSTVNSDVVDKALNKYNKHLKPKRIKTQFVSPFRIGKNIIKTPNVEAYVDSVDSVRELTPTRVHTDRPILNSFMSEQERTTYARTKKAGKASKAYVTRQVAKVFNSTVKGIDMQVMNTSEVKSMYGDSFTSKKGFIVGSKVILNSDNMTADTVFHEFSHFYIKWLEKHDKTAYQHLLKTVAEEYSGDIATYTKIYDDTGLKYSEEDIIVEIFADKMGMLVANDMDSFIEGSDTTINETIENYTNDFLKKLTRNSAVNSSDMDFGLMSSIADMFDIGLLYKGGIEGSPLFEDNTPNQVQLLKEFTIEEPNARELFNGLIARGLVTKVSDDTVILTDLAGNRYNAKGEIDPDASYKYYSKWDTPAHVRANERFLTEIHPYLDTFKNEAQVFFSTINVDVMSIVDKVKNNSANVTLNAEETHYVLTNPDGTTTELERTTQYLGDKFSSGRGEEYAISHIWSEKINEYKLHRAPDGMSESEKDTNAIAFAKNFIEGNSEIFRDKKEDVMRIFAFKADEGTYLHDLAEFYFRTLQYSNEIDFGSKMKGGYVHFAKPIIEKISFGGSDFTSYIDNNFIANLQDKTGTPEYKAYVESYQKMKGAIADSRTNLFTKNFLDMLTAEVIPVLNKLPGPISIMPEVQLASKSLGVAGKLDLVVIDGTGRAHIFDYKTKTEGREFWWDYNSPIKMEGVMGDYADNAMMKASIQTSIYKLMLMEMGIQVAPSNIFYVNNALVHKSGRNGKAADDVYYDKTKMEYKPSNIRKKPVLDVSAEMVEHFTAEGKTLDFIEVVDKSRDLKETLLKATGGIEIDSANTAEEDARRAYDRALNTKISEGEEAKDEIMKKLIADYASKTAGITVTLVGNTQFKLPVGVSEKEAIALITEAIKNKRAAKNIEAEFINRFNKLDRRTTTANGSERTTERDEAYRSLLVDVDSTTHEVTKMSSNVDYGMDSSGILFIKNKVTKGTRAIILNHDGKRNMDFGNGNSNIFGNFISDKKAKNINPRGSMKANNYNMRLLKMGIIMAQQKLIDPDFSIEVIVSNSPFSDRTIPDIHDVATVLKLAKDMLTTMQESGEELPTSMTELLEHPHLFESKSYMENPVDALLDYLSITTGALVSDTDFFNSNAKAIARKARLKDLLSKPTGFRNTQEILDALREFRHTLSLSKDRSLNSKIHDDLWTLTDQVQMFLNGFNYLISPVNTDMSDNFLMSTSKTANMYQTYFNRKITESTTNIREEFIDFKREHNKLIDDIAASKGISLGAFGSALYTTSRKRIFDNLYAHNNDGDRNKAFKLRNPDKPGKTTRDGQTPLNRAEIAYLRFFKKQAQKFSDVSTLGKQPVVPFGWMPLMRKSNLSNRADTSIFERTRERLDKSTRTKGAISKKEKPKEADFTVENRFQGQIPVDASKEAENWTRARRDALGVDDTGTVVDKDVDISKIEDNLENVLDTFAVASLEAYHYRDVSEFGKSMFYNIKRYENLSGGTSYDQIISTLSLIQKRVIRHEQSDSSSELLNVANSLATSVVSLGTINQALLETFTNPLITTSTYVADKLYGVMFSGTREFSAANFAKASTMIWTSMGKDKQVIEALDNLYGMTNMDTKNLKEALNKLESNSMFQTKHLMFVNKIMLENWQKITMVAYMLEQGTFYAHSVDTDGTLVYDESEDKRFSAHGGTLITQADKKAFYLATKLELQKQRNGLTGTSDDKFENRKLKRAWTNYDVNYLKELIVEAYSSMDESSKSLATYYTFTGVLFKMRTWLFPKIPRYFQKPMSAEQNSSASRLVKVPEEGSELGYRYEWKGSETEGIIYTVGYIMRALLEEKHHIFKKGAFKFRNDDQKKNMSKLLADAGVVAFLYAGVNGVWAHVLDEEDKDREIVKLIHDRILMASSDVFLIKSLIDVTTGNGSLFIGGAIAVRATQSLFNAVGISAQAAFDPDVGMTEIGSAFHELGGNTIGVYKSVALAAQEIYYTE